MTSERAINPSVPSHLTATPPKEIALTEHNPISRHVLNLGAGVQSTTLYLMYLRGEIQPVIECAIFADTGEEPASIYRHLEWMKVAERPADHHGKNR
jgi:hypothetical protein